MRSAGACGGVDADGDDEDVTDAVDDGLFVDAQAVVAEGDAIIFGDELGDVEDM